LGLVEHDTFNLTVKIDWWGGKSQDGITGAEPDMKKRQSTNSCWRDRSSENWIQCIDMVNPFQYHRCHNDWELWVVILEEMAGRVMTFWMKYLECSLAIYRVFDRASSLQRERMFDFMAVLLTIYCIFEDAIGDSNNPWIDLRAIEPVQKSSKHSKFPSQTKLNIHLANARFRHLIRLHFRKGFDSIFESASTDSECLYPSKWIT
jgi:hypothetical protein